MMRHYAFMVAVVVFIPLAPPDRLQAQYTCEGPISPEVCLKKIATDI